MIISNSQSAIRRFALMSTVMVVVALAETSHAQIEEVVVTATKREQSLQDVGVAVTAFSGEELRDRNIVRPQELFNEVPNVSVQTNSVAGQMLVSMRGLSFATFSPIGVQPVIVFQDEIPHSSPATAGLFIFDLERVEVLRGPQNILLWSKHDGWRRQLHRAQARGRGRYTGLRRPVHWKLRHDRPQCRVRRRDG